MKGKTAFIVEVLTGVTLSAGFVLHVIIITKQSKQPHYHHLTKRFFHNYCHLNISNINCHGKNIIKLIEEEEKEEVGYDAIHHIEFYN